nr:UDP-3-O-acyl-N-acetylglucosamine deacetylase [Desulfobulbaceae bacterium]
MEIYQHTLKKSVSFCGIGLHTGAPVELTISPAPANSGIRFKFKGNDDSMPAYMNSVVDTRLATTIASHGMVFSTTEHLLGALAGLGIDNALVELDAPELPIMDGSAGPFVHILKKASRKEQKASRRVLKITEEICYREGDKDIRILPHDGLKFTCNIDFDHEFVKSQTYTFELSPEAFVNEIASARTFGFIEQVEMLQQNGYALGGSLDNAVVIDRNGVINEDGLRFNDEFVRHKILDLIGDLALLGCPMFGHVIASKSGHSQHLGLMKEIAAHPEKWQIVELQKNGESCILEKIVNTTKSARNMLLPFLIPPADFPGSCPAVV